MLARLISLLVATIGILLAAIGFSDRPAMQISGGSGDLSDDALVRAAAKMIDGKSHGPAYRFSDLLELPYSANSKIKKVNCHAGQRKLLLTEIEFLTSCAAANGIIIYAGSAPCEKLPVLLKMFPGKKFLLVDPNFHSFHAPDARPTVVYQNVDRVSSTTLAGARKDMRLGDRTGQLSHEDKKRFQNISLQDKPPIYKSDYLGDMTKTDDPKHVATMRKVQSNFESANYRTMIGDLVAGNSRVFIIQDYMTESLCKLVKESIVAAGSPAVCFISDLRTVFFGPAPIDLDYMWNDAIQLIFLKILRPDWSMLKFHPPYFDHSRSIPLIDEMLGGSTRHAAFPAMVADFKTCRDQYGLDFIGNYRAAKDSHVYTYFKSSNIWLQAWAPVSSSEARLVISAADIDSGYQKYDARQWDNRFMYNKIMRGYAFYPAFYEQIKDVGGHTYDGCYDCALEMLILLNYAFRAEASAKPGEINVAALVAILEKPGSKETLVSLQKQIDDIVVYSSFQKCQFHGQLTKPLKKPIFYESAGNQMNQIWVGDNDLVIRKPVVKYQAGKMKILPGAKFRLGENVPEISEKNKMKFIEPGR